MASDEHKFKAISPSGLIRRCVFCGAKEMQVVRGVRPADCPGVPQGAT